VDTVLPAIKRPLCMYSSTMTNGTKLQVTTKVDEMAVADMKENEIYSKTTK
jgi:hypothetical protein